MTRSFVSVTPQRIVLASCALVVALFAIGWMTREDPGEKPLLQVLGGGFVYNYRLSQMHYGLSAAVAKPLTSGSIIEASFEDPAGGAAHTVRERATPRATRYALHSPPIRGVEANRPYRVAVRVLDRQGEAVLWSRDLDFVSQVDDRIVAEVPLTVGPGHHPNVAGYWGLCTEWWCKILCERNPRKCRR